MKHFFSQLCQLNVRIKANTDGSASNTTYIDKLYLYSDILDSNIWLISSRKIKSIKKKVKIKYTNKLISIFTSYI